MKSNQKGISAILILIAVVLVFGIYLYMKKLPQYGATSKNNVELTMDEEGAKVPLEDISQGCLGGKDCIPSIDAPVYETIMEADEWLEGTDIVFGVNYRGVLKAYPQRIMNWHEIVNDNFGEDKVVVTFCPLCGTAISFLSQVNGKDAEFGVSGKLYNSDLIMYDRTEGNYWQQATGEAIVGPAARRDEYLDMLSTTTTTWDQWKTEHPTTEVLSKDTGYSRDYDRYPYGSYEENGEIYFGVQNSDNRLHAKTVTYGILVGETAKAYVDDSLNIGDTNDTVVGNEITITKTSAGEVTFKNISTGDEIIPVRGFWFAWAAFYPDTLLFE